MKKRAHSRLTTIEKPINIERKPIKKSKGISERAFLNIKKYVYHLPALLLSIPFYLGSYNIVTKIHPEQIRHTLLPNTYLPLLAIVFMGNLFFFNFLFLKTRRGFLSSLLILLLLFFKLQQVIFEWWWITLLCGSFLGIELVITLIISYNKKI